MPIPEDLDKDKIAELSLALLALSAHGNELEMRAWKGMDWDVSNLLYQKGWIYDPKNKSKSVVFTPEGHKLAEQYLEQHFKE